MAAKQYRLYHYSLGQLKKFNFRKRGLTYDFEKREEAIKLAERLLRSHRVKIDQIILIDGVEDRVDIVLNRVEEDE